MDSGHAQGIQIAAITRFTNHLLTRPIPLSTDANSEIGLSWKHRCNLSLDLLHSAKVNQHDLAVAPPSNQVSRLDIAVNNMILVDKLQNIQHILENIDHDRFIQSIHSRNLIAKRLSFHILLRQIKLLVLFKIIQESGNLVMTTQLSQRLDLSCKQTPSNVQKLLILSGRLKLLDDALRAIGLQNILCDIGLAKPTAT